MPHLTLPEAEGPIAATITAHHLLYNRNEIFKGGIRPHYYCLPVLKRETHRQTLVSKRRHQAVRVSSSALILHRMPGLKEHACGCAGCYTAMHAMELYAQAFDQVGALDKLEGFAGFHGLTLSLATQSRSFEFEA